jgi:hypothetical protein
MGRLNTPDRVAREFRDRFELVTSTRGGLLLDAASGAFYRLNSAATAIADALRTTCDRDRAIAAHAAERGIDRSTAARDVDALLDLASATGTRSNRNRMQFERSDDALTLTIDAVPVLRVTHATSDLEVRWTANPSHDVTASLVWLAPHLIMLAGGAVLHASAVARGNAVYAFTGESGAGKTTLARTFVDAGATLVSEDLVFVLPESHRTRVVLEAEQAIRGWAAARSEAVAAGRVIRGREVLERIAGPELPLAELWFVDSARRGGERIVRGELEEIEAVALLLSNSFSEVGSSEVFRRTFAQSVSIARSARLSTVIVPDGIDRLAEALRQLQ